MIKERQSTWLPTAIRLQSERGMKSQCRLFILKSDLACGWTRTAQRYSSGPVWRLDATDVMLREHPVRGGQKHHLARTWPKSKHPLLLCLHLHAEFNRQHEQHTH